MAGFLIAEEGPLAGLIVRFEEGNEWIIGRDPNVSFQVLEDPMVSRKHVICRLEDGEFSLENLSAINPANINGKPVLEPTAIQEGDTVQIGNVFFRFTLNDPANAPSAEEVEKIENETPTIYEESEDLEELAFSGGANARWIIKVISGPNAGAEFGLHEGISYTIGKDPNSADIIFQDLSVSREHAKIMADKEGFVLIEDLNSRNKVLVNGLETEGSIKLNSQDLIALGTTSFLVIDQEKTRETIVSPPSMLETGYYTNPEEREEREDELHEEKVKKNWKQMTIRTKHLITAGLFAFLFIFTLSGVFSLFKGESIEVEIADASFEIKKTLKGFPEVEFSFNKATSQLFLLGHVMTEVDHQELFYLVRSLPFVRKVEDNVIIDERVWENSNALISRNPSWRGVTLTSIIPGHFVLRGYVQTTELSVQLSEYTNLNFPYLDRLENQVVVENTLEAQIQSILLENQFVNVTFQFANGELILSGRVAGSNESPFNQMLKTLNKLKGIRTVRNFVIFTNAQNEFINISSKYTVTGSSKHGKSNQFVMISGRILSKGDNLDGMFISEIDENTVFLEKDGIKYKITYNQK